MGLAGLACACLLGLGGVARASTFAGRLHECAIFEVRDYGAPLESLKQSPPPDEHELPFGPRGLSLYRLEFSPVVLQGTRIGYGLARQPGTDRDRRLNWIVAARLLRVDGSGASLGQVGSLRRRFATVRDSERRPLSFPARRPGLYRLDLTFRRFDGRLLGHYTEHFRVLRRHLEADLATEALAYRPGDTVYGRVENPGTSTIVAPAFLGVERFESGSWIEVPQPPDPDSIMRTRYWMLAGEASPCHAFAIPAGAPPGLYRFHVSARSSERRAPLELSAEFSVEA